MSCIPVEMVGRRFGRLLVRECAVRSKNNQFTWKCLCDCGKTTVVLGGNLRSGAVRSCGCLSRELTSARQKLPTLAAILGIRRSEYKVSAKKRGLAWDLSDDDFVSLVIQDCHYCGDEPSQIRTQRCSSETYVTTGIDRLDSSLGYIVGNVVPCCKICNTAKSTMSVEEFFAWIERVYRRRTCACS
jgi:hypothetical protein